MSIPSSILSLFNGTYDGVPAAQLKSANEAHNVEIALREAGQSFQTRIKKTIATKPTKSTTIEKMTSRSVKPLRDLICMILQARCSARRVAVLIALLCRDIRVVRPSAR